MKEYSAGRHIDSKYERVELISSRKVLKLFRHIIEGERYILFISACAAEVRRLFHKSLVLSAHVPTQPGCELTAYNASENKLIPNYSKVTIPPGR